MSENRKNKEANKKKMEGKKENIKCKIAEIIREQEKENKVKQEDTREW